MATADVRTFWSAFVSVLLKCIAALGFATPARTKTPAVVAGTAAAPATTTATGLVTAPASDGTAAAGTPAADTNHPGRRTNGRTPAIPAPRCAYAYPPRRTRRGRTLPPTMKQRIHAEAHGASPSARKVLAADAFDSYDAADAAGFTGSTVIPAPRPRVRGARCE